MSQLAVCPRCHTMLDPAEDSAKFRCKICGGTFVMAESSNPSGMSTVSNSMPTTAGPSASPRSLSCPFCLSPLRAGDPPERFDCLGCGGQWSDGSLPTGTTTKSPVSDVPVPATAEHSPFIRSLLYGMSLPERVLRSGVGLAADTARELSGMIVPQAFQSSKSYQIAIHDSLGFLAETVGGMGGASARVDEAGEHVARKAIGNLVDLAGLATLHVSPMWLLAITSDLAYGGRVYIQEVAATLQEQGVIDETSTIHGVDDLLDAIQRSCSSAAGAFDKPPLSVEELQRVVAQTRQEIGRVDVTKVLPEAELRRLWAEMQTVASQDGVGLLGVSSAMTMHTLERVKTVSSGAITGIQVAGGLLNRNVVDHYRQALNRIQQQGFYATLQETYRPYADAVWNNFSRERKSWTESLLDPGNVSAAVGKLFSLLEGKQGTGSGKSTGEPEA